ncbi:hypothetical protein GGR56DRAFT_672553 [Xylariaceae sp. FL0804]|nr:hypothetical protein GGR56DRAFT_672553 [Xylariaceae sp. FL0804]
MSLKIQSRVLHRLWKMMLHSFQACPYELFTWGLYPHHNDRADILEELCKLLPHKLWGGRLWLLRYMLQMSVFSRCKNHMEPLGPLSSEMMDLVCSLVGSPAEGDSPQLKARRATTALSLWKATRPELEPRVAGVIRALHERAQSEAEADSSGVGEEEQHHKDEDEDEDEETSRLNSTIFLLRKADVVRLRQSLDSLPFFDHTADEFFQAYEASYASVWDELEPRDAATLYRWECLCTRKCIRDQMCREPIIPAAELQTFLRAPYWGSPYCDPRFRASLVPRGEPREPEHQD